MARRWLALLPLATTAVMYVSAASASRLPSHAQAEAPPGPRIESTARPDVPSADRGHAVPSCSDPSSDDRQWCAAVEKELIESVIRLEVGALDEEGQWAAAIGHGTVISGRFLVTHNHFELPLELLESEVPSFDASASLYRADGQKIRLNGEVVHFTVVAEDSQTLVLDFGTDGAGKGFFESRGVGSARFRTIEDLAAEPGEEVAKVDWSDGKAYLEWTQIKAIRVDSGTEILALSEDSKPGASGGGVFCQGYHVANIWSSVEVFDGTGNVLGTYSKAALNSQRIMPSFGEPTPE